MKLSAKMPAQMDSTLAAKMPATMPSDSQQTGDGGSDDAPVVEIVTQTQSQRGDWQSLNEVGEKWQTTDKKTGTCGDWELCERVEGNKGEVAQSDPDNDSDSN